MEAVANGLGLRALAVKFGAPEAFQRLEIGSSTPQIVWGRAAGRKGNIASFREIDAKSAQPRPMEVRREGLRERVIRRRPVSVYSSLSLTRRVILTLLLSVAFSKASTDEVEAHAKLKPMHARSILHRGNMDSFHDHQEKANTALEE